MGALTIETPQGELHTYDAVAQVRFGRSGALELPLVDPATGTAHPFMSRHVGTFELRDDIWWLDNEPPPPDGQPRTLLVRILGSDPVPLAPGASIEVRGSGTVTFPPEQYTLRFRAGADRGVERRAIPPGEITRQDIELTARQVDYLVTLAEPELSHTPSALRRSMSEIAALWGVKPGTVEVALRDVRARLVNAKLLDGHDNGQPGVTDALARVVVDRHLIVPADLEWAATTSPDGPRRAADGPRYNTMRENPS